MKRLAPLLLTLALPLLLGPNCRQSALLPTLVASSPGDGATVARSAWLLLEFASGLGGKPGSRLWLTCDGAFEPLRTATLQAVTLVVQPKDLPAGATCELQIDTVTGVETLSFQTAAAGAPFEATFDRTDPDRPLPFPDDVFLVPEPANPTGFALDLVYPNNTGTARALLRNMGAVAEAQADGWSPVGNLSVEISAAADGSSLPLDRAASLDPLSTVALIDMTSGAASHGERVPFTLIPRSDSFGGPVTHALILFAGMPLDSEGVYGLVVTDRVLDGAGEPLARSSFFQAAVEPPVGGEAPEVTATRPLVEEVLSLAETLDPVPIPRDDVVLATRMTIRSTDHFVNDPLAMRADVMTVPPNVQITDVRVDFHSDVAAYVEGTFDVPDWRGGSPYLQRDVDGTPLASGTQALPFLLALPTAAASQGHAPVLMYQHGNPGSAENEVPNAARSFLGRAGFAMGGFTDTFNRQFADVQAQTLAVLGNVLVSGAAPDFWLQTFAEQMAFVRALQSLDTLDVLPLGAPDGIPDIDPSRLVYEGISNGSNHGQAFLAYEPAIVGAGMVVGAMRLAELLEYQDRTLPTGGDALLRVQLPAFVSGLRWPDLWFGLQLFSLSADPQDPHNHARFLYREPISVDGTTQKASLLVVEGIDDSYVSNNSTRSLARQLGGIPQLDPSPVPLPDLPTQAGPIQGNIDATTTAAMVQYVPAGSAVPLTPGCQFQFEGHFCAQTNPTARAQRVDFYDSAVVGVPIIDD